MASSSAACVLGGVRLISSARIMLAKTGPRRNRKLRVPGGLVFLDDLGAGDVRGHQVGRELDAAEGQVQRLGQGGDQQRLGQPGHAVEQAVAAGEQGDQQFFDHLRPGPTMTLPTSPRMRWWASRSRWAAARSPLPLPLPSPPDDVEIDGVSAIQVLPVAAGLRAGRCLGY